ncbi:extracellular catalytic domain type 2 short-chain-length polyhydroxyalkanoate depolymerase [Paraburkholderia bannensis]|uniref:extracellular catalytic domain type 2 short-chain-length polyhydroxyalkanoate depolymerase n=1 Tax=Paraburkholderia bannensis TaxID=765414 RepID=UPI002AB6E472|nr:poly(3-hydroxybutyrate) depolymerase [Paraburkholderia bannensis]
MQFGISPKVEKLGRYAVLKGQSSISGLSSGAFMTVQLHLAHSASFSGVGVIAGGPFRCAESFRGAAPLAEDAYVQSAEYICMSPLTAAAGPDANRLADLARSTAQAGKIDPVANLKDDRVFLFSGTQDSVVHSTVVKCTELFYRQLGVNTLTFDDTVAAGHCIVTDNPEDSMLALNQPPYINRGDGMLSHKILRHLYDGLEDPSERPTGRIVRFDQREFFDNEARASMSEFGYAYLPRAVELDGKPARVHIVLHGCKQGYGFVNFVNGREDVLNQVSYGNRYITTTGYNEIADSNNIIVLYPQAAGSDGSVQNPDGCWDWWGYTSPDPQAPDYYSRDAIQIRAIHRMLTQLGG